jgi:predicted PurR-regulated permease PerM
MYFMKLSEDRFMVKKISSAVVFIGLSFGLAIVSPASYAQTTNPQLNQLLRDVQQMERDTEQWIQDLMEHDRQLRSACWQGSQAACMDLDDLLINPNADPSGRWITPPSGAYWPFDHNGIPLY